MAVGGRARARQDWITGQYSCELVSLNAGRIKEKSRKVKVTNLDDHTSLPYEERHSRLSEPEEKIDC